MIREHIIHTIAPGNYTIDTTVFVRKPLPTSVDLRSPVRPSRWMQSSSKTSLQLSIACFLRPKTIPDLRFSQRRERRHKLFGMLQHFYCHTIAFGQHERPASIFRTANAEKFLQCPDLLAFLKSISPTTVPLSRQVTKTHVQTWNQPGLPTDVYYFPSDTWWKPTSVAQHPFSTFFFICATSHFKVPHFPWLKHEITKINGSLHK